MNILSVPAKAVMRRRVCYEEEGGRDVQKFSFWLVSFERHTGGVSPDAQEVLRHMALKFRDMSIN